MEWNDPAFAMRGRSHQELQAIMKDDMVIYIMKTLLESIFGGLWLLVLVAISVGLKDIVRISLFGFSDSKEHRTFRNLQNSSDRVRLGAFFLIVLTITVVMLRSESGRRMLSYGSLTFLLCSAFYYLYFSDALYQKKGAFAGLNDRQESDGQDDGQKATLEENDRIVPSEKKPVLEKAEVDNVVHGEDEAPTEATRQRKSKKKTKRN